MRNLLIRLSGVAIILAAMPIMASAAAGGVPLGPIVIPDKMGDAVYESVKDFEKTDPGAGQGARLQGSATRIDVFTYPSVQTRVPDGFSGEVVAKEFEIAAGQIRDRWKVIGSAMDLPGTCLKARMFVVSKDGTQAPSVLALTGFAGRFLKVRLTWEQPVRNPAAEAGALLRTFCEDLVRVNARPAVPSTQSGFLGVPWGASPQQLRRVIPEAEGSDSLSARCTRKQPPYDGWPHSQARCESILHALIPYAGRRALAVIHFDDSGGMLFTEIVFPKMPRDASADGPGPIGAALVKAYGAPSRRTNGDAGDLGLLWESKGEEVFLHAEPVDNEMIKATVMHVSRRIQADASAPAGTR